MMSERRVEELLQAIHMVVDPSPYPLRGRDPHDALREIEAELRELRSTCSREAHESAYGGEL